MAEGDGELSGTAIEASANAVVQLTVRKDLRLTGPMLETPTHWIAHGFDEDLDRAMKSAARALLTFLVEQRGLSRDDAYSLIAVAGDFGVTQVVDQRQGVHGMIAKNLFLPSGRWNADAGAERGRSQGAPAWLACRRNSRRARDSPPPPGAGRDSRIVVGSLAEPGARTATTARHEGAPMAPTGPRSAPASPHSTTSRGGCSRWSLESTPVAYDLVVRGGLVATATDAVVADLGIRGGGLRRLIRGCRRMDRRLMRGG